MMLLNSRIVFKCVIEKCSLFKKFIEVIRFIIE